MAPIFLQVEGSKLSSPFSIPNIRLFILFRVLFNSRFYYPVFTILFLDFGLSVAQFSILNAIWAATIVLAEVPSGALADIVGRRRLLIFSAVTMVVEIGVIAFLPVSNPSIVFTAFLVNRVLSGLAQASASGADEAIAYDSLVEAGRGPEWGRVLEVLARCQSMGFIVAMTVGAAVYDPQLVGTLLGWFGFHAELSQQVTMKFPLYLTFAMGIGLLWTALSIEDAGVEEVPAKKGGTKEAFRLTLAAGGWIIRTPFVFSVILFGLLFDGVIRMVITLASQYYRVIQLPESIFGILGSMVAMLGFVIPRVARKIAEKRSPAFGMWVVSGLTFTGLFGMNFFWPKAGIIPAIVTFSAMYFNGFFVSFYVNEMASSEQRATVLSFKGLAYNLSYGALGVLYSLVLKARKSALAGRGELSPEGFENAVFMDTFIGFPAAFLVGLFLILSAYRLWLRERPLSNTPEK